MKRKYIYSVLHVEEYVEDFEQRKDLGKFTSRQKAQEALEEYKKLPGFKEDTEEELFIVRKKLGLSFYDGGFFYIAEFIEEGGGIVEETDEEEEIELILDIPAWVPQASFSSPETPEELAHKLLASRVGSSNYPQGPGSEFFQIKRLKELYNQDRS